MGSLTGVTETLTAAAGDVFAPSLTVKLKSPRPPLLLRK
jgi:hypothetical protein